MAWGMTTISKQAFVADLTAQNGTIDVDHLSSDLLRSMKDVGLVDDNGVSTQELTRIAGADGRIRGNAEMGALFDLVDSFDRSPATKSPSFSVAPEPGLDGQPTAPPSGVLHDALKDEVARNRTRAWYASPRATVAPEQAQKYVATDALTTEEGARKPPVDLRMTGMSQYTYAAKHGLDGDTACAVTAFAQANEHNAKKLGARAPKLEGPEQAIQVAYQEDANGRTVADGSQAARGREYIDKCLEKGLPAVVGVSYSHDNAQYNEGVTDHFITIDGRGHDEAGRAFYTYKDPGDGGRAGKLYVDQSTQQLFKEERIKDAGYVKDLEYQVTQVRTYSGVR